MSTKVKISGSVTPEIIVPHISKTEKEAAKEQLEKFIKDDVRKVKGTFRCYETPGSTTRIQIRKYKDVPMFDMSMMDGQVYEVPLYVARHLNGTDITATKLDGKVNTCSYPVHGYKWNQGSEAPQSAMGAIPNGPAGIPVPLLNVAKRVRRYGFESLEFQIA